MNGVPPWAPAAPHFTVLVHGPMASSYDGEALAFPEGSPFLAQPLPSQLVQLPIRTHMFEISPQRRIQVVTSWIPADLKLDVTLTSPGGV